MKAGPLNDPAHPVNRLGRTTEYESVSTLHLAHDQPVVLQEFTLNRIDGLPHLFVRASTGHTGCAKGSLRHQVHRSILTDLVLPYFVGKDARDIERLLVDIYCQGSHYKYAGMPFHNSVALVELATLDLLSSVADQPVYAFFGKKLRDSHPVYLSRFDRDTTPEAEAEGFLAAMESTGARAIKVKIGGRMSANRDGYPGRTEALIPHLAAALPAGTTLYADANGSYDVAEAVRVGRLLEQHGYGFFEEPCPWQEFEATKAVADLLDIPIAGGEQDSSSHQFAWYLRHDGLDLLQPDLLYNGGFIRTVRVARAAAAMGVPVVPHSPVALHWPYLAHFAAITPNLGPFLEQSPGFHISGGAIHLGDRIGWGWEREPSGEVIKKVPG